MSKNRIKLRNGWIDVNDNGIQDMLCDSQIQSMVRKIASEKASQAGPGYEYRAYLLPGPRRAAANIYPATYEAVQDNYENNTLIKVVGV